MSETQEARLKRMKMRSNRRGIKEMDVILGGFAAHRLEGLTADELDLYDVMLSENDHDLYAWVSGQSPTPERFSALISKISEDLGRK